jgi:hypothetical protein
VAVAVDTKVKLTCKGVVVAQPGKIAPGEHDGENKDTCNKDTCSDSTH